MKILNLFSIGLGLGLGVTVVSATTIYDDFNDGEDSSPAWVLIDASGLQGGPAGERTFGLSNTEYRLHGAALASVRGDFTLQDGIARVELKQWDSAVSGGSSVGLVVRFTPGTLSGYFISIDFDGSPSLNLVRLDGGVPGVSSGGLNKTFDPSKTYILEAETAGTLITGRVYEKDGDAVTLFDQVSFTNSGYAAGVCGLLVAQDSFPSSFAPSDATFDNFFATDGVVEQVAMGNLEIVGDQFRFRVGAEPGRPYLIEYKADWEFAPWTVLTNFSPMSLPGSNLVTDTGFQLRRFYRASTPAD